MPTFRTGVVEEVLGSSQGVQSLRVRVDGQERRAVLLTRYAAPASAGDEVVLNTTAADLGLGSGGEDFVVWNLAASRHDSGGDGHIVKLRYTPIQSQVLAVEAPESPHHEAMAAAGELAGMPVLAASLHSQLLPVVVGLRSLRPEAGIAYVMTDGGALSAELSVTVRRLRELGWLETVVTVGHAIGGDLEAVNLYSGLLAARAAAGCDVAVVGMGPGVVGTSTRFGTTALEMGLTLNAAAALGGRGVAVVRMSSGDARDRHAGVSHHALTALERVALAAADVPVPMGHVAGLEPAAARHRLVEIDVAAVATGLEDARALGLRESHMGRGLAEDRLFFEAAGAAGIHAASMIDEGAR